MSVVGRTKGVLKTALTLALFSAAALALWAWARSHPANLPWTPLDIAQPPGAFTIAKMTRLRDTPGACAEQLESAGVRFVTVPPRSGESCGYSDAVRLRPGGALPLKVSPSDVGTSCPVAAGLAMWSWTTLGPAARRILGSPVATVEHFGSFSCRRLYGRETGAWSEHATANAFDVAGFVLADGRRITVARDWSDGEKGRFLHAARDGACRVFGTVLSPDYNAAHADHLHLDQAAGRVRGVCR